ncbi:MAG: hypothetical protein ABH844_04005 [Candidatus Omnitrophota bacterium]
MKKNFKTAAFLVFVFVFSALAVNAYAYDKGKFAKAGASKACHADFGQKFTGKAHLLLSKQEELGLTDEQAQQIKDLKIKMEKDSITKQAEIDLVDVDIKAEFWKDDIDVDAVNTLIDSKYELKKEKEKSTIIACVVLKSMLTEEQIQKMKQLCKLKK